MKNSLVICFILCAIYTSAQPYTSYFTGNVTDLDTSGQSGICLMGGATEDDNAMTWFLERANGGDVLVLRASGSDGYNNYMYSGLGVTVNSVETIVFNNATASNDAYVHQAILDAEAIWFAGGDQWDYISYWRNTPVDSLIKWIVQNKNAVIGGTSAGMAIMGGNYFSAENGTVTSSVALSNPFNNNVTVDNTPFLENDILADVITDTHYDNPDRKGRHVTFMARILQDSTFLVKGIACQEYVAVCIDENGIAKVFGGYPTWDENAFFIQVNCDNIDIGLAPENCTNGASLTWNKQNTALQVYKMPGTPSGNNSFNLNDWTTATGGEWQHWWVENGVLNEDTSTEINCSQGIGASYLEIEIYPNPSSGALIINTPEPVSLKILNLEGQLVYSNQEQASSFQLDLSELSSGIYVLSAFSGNKVWNKRIILNN